MKHNLTLWRAQVTLKTGQRDNTSLISVGPKWGPFHSLPQRIASFTYHIEKAKKIFYKINHYKT